MPSDFNEKDFDVWLRGCISPSAPPLTRESRDVLLAVVGLLSQIGKGIQNPDDAMALIVPHVERLELHGSRIELLHTQIAEGNIWKTTALFLSMDQSHGILQAKDLWDEVFSNLEAGHGHGLELAHTFELADVYKKMGHFINKKDRPEYLIKALGKALGSSSEIKNLYHDSMLDSVKRHSPVRSLASAIKTMWARIRKNRP